MTDPNIFDQMHRDVDAAGGRDNAASDRVTNRTNARANIEAARALDRMANAFDDFFGALAVSSQVEASEPATIPEYRKLVVGDVVLDADGVEAHVDETGYTEGEQWVTIIREDGTTFGRIWSRHLTFVRHKLADAPVANPNWVEGATEHDDVAVDFDEETEVTHADAFSAARGKVKGKKGGK